MALQKQRATVLRGNHQSSLQQPWLYLAAGSREPRLSHNEESLVLAWH